MATIVNARDTELQATSPRLVAVAGPTNVTTDFAQINGSTKPSNNADVTSTAVNSGVTATAGGITLSGGGAIKGGQSGYDSGTGFFLGYSSSAYKLSIGNSSGNKLTWNGSTLGIVGSITGSSDLNITGNARFAGAYSGSAGIGAIYANETLAADIGAVVFAGSSGGILGKVTGTGGNRYGVRGLSTSSTASTMAVSGETTTAGVAGLFTAGNAAATGVYAENTAGGTALSVAGHMAVDNSTWTWNGYTIAAPAGSSTTVLHNDGVWRDPVTTARVNAAFGVAATGVCQIMVGDTGTATMSGGGANIACGTGLAGTYQFACASNNIVLQTVSDIRIKQDIEDEQLGLEFVLSLKPKTYRMRADKKDQKTRYHGFIADDMERQVPEGDSLYIVHPNGLKGTEYISYIGPLVLAVQQLAQRVIQLEAKKS